MINVNSIIYQLVTDRFDNEEGTLELRKQESDYEQNLNGIMGGNFKGIERRAEYLESLGITHLLISPVEECARDCYHAYTTTRQGIINKNFGGSKNLKSLIKEMEKRGIGLILDSVPLASSRGKILKKAEKSIPGSESRKRYFFKESIYDPDMGEDYQRLYHKIDCGTGDYLYFYTPEMPLLNLRNQEVFKEQSNRIKTLIEKYGFSDVRIDMGYCLPEDRLKELTEEIHKLGMNVSVLSENWPHPIEEFNGGEEFGLCDGEFNLKGTILLNNYGIEPHLIKDLRNHFIRTKGKSDLGYTLITGIDSHDLPRFKRKGEHSQKIASVIQFTFPNFTPLIYYGNESFMQNEGNDHLGLARGVMNFSYTPLLDHYKSLIKFRKAQDFRGTKMSNFQIYDTEEGTNFQNQLITYNLYHTNGKINHIVINYADRTKPIRLEEMVLNEEVIPIDILTEQRLEKLEDGRHLIQANSAYILGNKRNG